MVVDQPHVLLLSDIRPQAHRVPVLHPREQLQLVLHSALVGVGVRRRPGVGGAQLEPLGRHGEPGVVEDDAVVLPVGNRLGVCI